MLTKSENYGIIAKNITKIGGSLMIKKNLKIVCLFLIIISTFIFIFIACSKRNNVSNTSDATTVETTENIEESSQSNNTELNEDTKKTNEENDAVGNSIVPNTPLDNDEDVIDVIDDETETDKVEDEDTELDIIDIPEVPEENDVENNVDNDKIDTDKEKEEIPTPTATPEPTPEPTSTPTPTPKVEPTKKPTPKPEKKDTPTPTPKAEPTKKPEKKDTPTPTPKAEPTKKPEKDKGSDKKAKTEKFYGVEIVGVDKFVSPKEGWNNNYEDLKELEAVLDEKYPHKEGLFIGASEITFSHGDSTSNALELVKNGDGYKVILRARLKKVYDWNLENEAELNRNILKVVLMKITPNYSEVYDIIYRHAEEDSSLVSKKEWTVVGDVSIKYESGDGYLAYYIKEAK